MPRSKAAIRRARQKYEKSGAIVRKVLKLHAVHDADIIEYLDSQDNVNGKLKQLIRDDIKRED